MHDAQVAQGLRQQRVIASERGLADRTGVLEQPTRIVEPPLPPAHHTQFVIRLTQPRVGGVQLGSSHLQRVLEHRRGIIRRTPPAE